MAQKLLCPIFFCLFARLFCRTCTKLQDCSQHQWLGSPNREMLLAKTRVNRRQLRRLKLLSPLLFLWCWHFSSQHSATAFHWLLQSLCQMEGARGKLQWDGKCELLPASGLCDPAAEGRASMPTGNAYLTQAEVFSLPSHALVSARRKKPKPIG